MTDELFEDLDAFILARVAIEFNRGTPPAVTLKIINQLLQKRLRASRAVQLQSLAH